VQFAKKFYYPLCQNRNKNWIENAAFYDDKNVCGWHVLVYLSKQPWMTQTLSFLIGYKVVPFLEIQFVLAFKQCFPSPDCYSLTCWFCSRLPHVSFRMQQCVKWTCSTSAPFLQNEAHKKYRELVHTATNSSVN